MAQYRHKLLTEQSPDITDSGSKENKLQPILLPASLLGPEDYSTELNLITTRNLITSAKLYKLQSSNVSNKAS